MVPQSMQQTRQQQGTGQTFNTQQKAAQKTNKTQRSLSENILDMNTFLKGGGKWMRAESLAFLGMEELLGELLKGKGVKKGKL